jgi:predicted amidophosphoribosyltransferase
MPTAGLVRVFALARYRGVGRRLLIAYKERGRRDLAPSLGLALAEALAVLPLKGTGAGTASGDLGVAAGTASVRRLPDGAGPVSPQVPPAQVLSAGMAFAHRSPGLRGSAGTASAERPMAPERGTETASAYQPREPAWRTETASADRLPGRLRRAGSAEVDRSPAAGSCAGTASVDRLPGRPRSVGSAEADRSPAAARCAGTASADRSQGHSPGTGAAPAPRKLCLVPAPSRPSASRVRGGPHVERLAEAAASVLAARGFDVAVAPALELAGSARDAVGLGHAQRAANLAGRLRFRHAGRPPPGFPVVVLDDVVTTGATAAACVHALAAEGIAVSAVLTLLAAG